VTDYSSWAAVLSILTADGFAPFGYPIFYLIGLMPAPVLPMKKKFVKLFTLFWLVKVSRQTIC
jgi:hypothetical protein